MLKSPDLIAVLTALRMRFNGFQRFSFLLDGSGGVRRAPDRAGQWVDQAAVSQLLDETCTDWLEKQLGVLQRRPLFDRFGILLDDIASFLNGHAQEEKARGNDSTAAGREAQAFALRELLHHLIAGHHVAAATGEVLFWYRPCSDGTFEGPLPDRVIEDVRKRCGAWVPLYAGSAPAASTPKAWPELLPLLNAYASAMTDASLHESASKTDIAKSQALKTLARLRDAIYGDAKSYGEVPR